jgi:hypothetical protein
VLFVGDDWAEAHHDIEIEDDVGHLLASRRVPEGLAGVTVLHELVAEHLDPSGGPDQVLVGIERLSAVHGFRRCSRPAMWCSRSTRCRWPAIGSGTPPRGRSLIRPMPICWLRLFGSIGRIIARLPGTPNSPSILRWLPGRIR